MARQRLRPGIAVLLTSGYARDLIPRAGPARLPDDRQALSQRGAGGQGAHCAGGTTAAHAAGAAGGSADAQPQPGPDHPRRVLFVEDEVVLRMSTVDMLERLGCVVSAVGSGEQALELLAAAAGSTCC